MKRKLLTALYLTLVLLLAAPAHAVIYSYFNEADYNAAVGAQLFFLDFNSETQASVASGNYAGMVDFGSPEASNPSVVLFNSFAMTDHGSTTANNNVGPVDGIFASPVHAFGLVFSSSGNPQTLELYNSSLSLIGTAVSNPGGFFGVYSDEAIGYFVIRNGEFSAGNRDRFFVDDFRANAPIPEPATLFLVGSGLAGLALRRRRK